MADNRLLGAGAMYYNGHEIGKAYIGTGLVWEKGPDYSQEYFTIKSLEDNNTITFTKYNQNSSYIAADKPIKYSKDLNTWTDISFVTDNSSQIVLSTGEKLYLKGNNSAYGEKLKFGYLSAANILSSGNIDVMGNIMSLVYGDNFINNNTIESYAFLSLFYNNNKLENTKDLILPATILTESCYFQMFYGCTSLLTAPKLPATTLSDYCYRSMFSRCSSLITAPELPATTLAQSCYASMFRSCISLINAPELPATTLINSCYSNMFRSCTSLINAPELPATTLTDYCYSYMFNSCTSLNYIKAMFTTTPSSTYTNNWVNGVSGTGTFVKNSLAEWDVTGTNGIPSGWTVQTASS